MLGTGNTSDVVVANGCAVKLYRDRRAGESRKQFRLRVELEYLLLKLLDHPHVVVVAKFATNWLGDTPKMYMELGTPNWWLNCQNKAEAMAQIVMAVVYLHHLGIAHRDLKLDNTVMVGGLVKLVDFAVATKTVPAVGLVGLALYVAPEQYTQISYLCMASDVWLVAMIFVRLFKVAPWWKLAHISDETYQEYVEKGALPAPVPAWVAQALTIDPELRPQIEAIAQLIDPQAISDGH